MAPSPNIEQRADTDVLSSFSYPGGEPPTPTRTPTSPDFFSSSFETPKQDSIFYNSRSPWSSAFASALSPSFKTPNQVIFTPPTYDPSIQTDLQRPATGQDGEAEIASYVHHQSPNPSLPLLPVEPSRQLTSSPKASSATEAKRSRLQAFSSVTTPLGNRPDREAAPAMNSAGSIQTPPPTSTSSSRRKAQQAQVARMVKESAAKGVRKISAANMANADHSEVPLHQVEESPSQFPNLQFSPEEAGFHMSGPATAPVYPQNKLFWDPDQSTEHMNLEFPMDDTFTIFGMGLQKHMDPFISVTGQASGIQFPNPPAFGIPGTAGHSMASITASSHAVSLNQTNISPTTAIMNQGSSRGKYAGTVVNPSLLFSSPGRASHDAEMPSSSHSIQHDALKPYAHQLRDAQIEKEMKGRKSKRKRGPEVDSPAVKATLQALREDRDGSPISNATAESDAMQSFNGPVRGSSGLSGRRPGHHHSRQGGQESHGHLSRHGSHRQHDKRTAVTLTIDASGRAKTEATVLAEDAKPPSGSRMDVDSGSEDSESSSSSSSAGIAMSQQQSFNYQPQKHQQPKLQRFVNDPKSHSQRSSYASTLASTNASNKLPENLGKRAASTRLQTQTQKFSSHRGPQDDDHSEAETIIDSEEEKGDAQSELKKVLQQRTNRNLSKLSSLPASRRSSAGQSRPYTSQAGPSHPYYTTHNMTPSPFDYQDPYSNISPTTITDPDLTTPSTGRDSTISSGSTRCICQISEGDGQLMVQW